MPPKSQLVESSLVYLSELEAAIYGVTSASTSRSYEQYICILDGTYVTSATVFPLQTHGYLSMQFFKSFPILGVAASPIPSDVGCSLIPRITTPKTWAIRSVRR
jgi:hypothetical protein